MFKDPCSLVSCQFQKTNCPGRVPIPLSGPSQCLVNVGSKACSTPVFMGVLHVCVTDIEVAHCSHNHFRNPTLHTASPHTLTALWPAPHCFWPPMTSMTPEWGQKKCRRQDSWVHACLALHSEHHCTSQASTGAAGWAWDHRTRANDTLDRGIFWVKDKWMKVS